MGLVPELRINKVGLLLLSTLVVGDVTVAANARKPELRTSCLILTTSGHVFDYRRPVITTVVMVSFVPEVAATRHQRVAVWIRGSSSRVHPKKAYRLEFHDENGDDLKTSLLSMPEESDWILYPAYRDKTLVRDILGYDLWREMGYYAPRWRFVELFIVTNNTSLKSNVLSPSSTVEGLKIENWKLQNSNSGNGNLEVKRGEGRATKNQELGLRNNPLPVGEATGRRLVPQISPPLNDGADKELKPPNRPKAPWYEGMPDIDSVWLGISKEGINWENYQGVYILMEKIKRGKDRVNIKKLKPEHGGEPAITGGYIFKRDRLNAHEEGFKSNKGIWFAYEEPKERDITPAQRSYLTNYVNEFEEVLFSDKFADPEQGYRKYIDVESFIDYHWLVEASRNVDGYTFSVFFYKDRNGKLKIGPVWDWDLSFGNCKAQGGTRTQGWQFGHVAGPEYEWYKRLFQDSDFLQRYIDRWAELRTNLFATSNLLARIDGYVKGLGKEAIDRNYSRWPTLGKKVFPNEFAGETYEAEVGWLKSWTADRLAWIDTQDFPPPVFVTTPLSGGTGTELKFGWLVGKVYYTLDGSDPRLSGGAVSSNALEYSNPISLPPNTHCCARVRSDDGLWSAPKLFQSHAH